MILLKRKRAPEHLKDYTENLITLIISENYNQIFFNEFETHKCYENLTGVFTKYFQVL